jgi:hypothetical protein
LIAYKYSIYRFPDIQFCKSLEASFTQNKPYISLPTHAVAECEVGSARATELGKRLQKNSKLRDLKLTGEMLLCSCP